MPLWPCVLGLRFVLTVGFSTAKQRVLEMSDTLLYVFPMLGMQKCPELQRTSLDGVQLLFSIPRRSRRAIIGWIERGTPASAGSSYGGTVIMQAKLSLRQQEAVA